MRLTVHRPQEVCYILLYFVGVWCCSILQIIELVQDCSISIANTLEILQSCTNPAKYHLTALGQSYQKDIRNKTKLHMFLRGYTHYSDLIMSTMASQINSLTIVY